jgi:hypothetical protein
MKIPKDYEGSKESGRRVKEDCQVSRIQNPKSLEDWHNIRVKAQEDDSTISPPARGGETEEGKTDSQKHGETQ